MSLNSKLTQALVVFTFIRSQDSKLTLAVFLPILAVIKNIDRVRNNMGTLSDCVLVAIGLC